MAYTINKEFVLGDNQGDSRVAQNMYIILHETANPKSTGRNEATYMHNNYQNAYTQFIVGDGLVYQVGAPGYVAWGALNGNPYSPAQIELQHTSDPELFKKNYAIYIELARDMANRYGIPLSLDAGGAGTKGIKTHNWITQNYGGDHTDPYGYLASMGVSKAKLASDLANGSGIVTTPVNPTAPATPTQPSQGVNVYYGLRPIGSGFLPEVTNLNDFAGNPNQRHDMLYIKVSHGTLKYRVHTLGGGWLEWVTKGDRNDTVNGCAGISGRAIDGVQMEYITPSGEPYQQAWYHSQTTARSGWLGAVCDQGQSIKDYTDSFAGMLGEPLDRLQIKIGTNSPY